MAIGRDSEKDLAFEGFVTFRDPPKADAAEAVRDLGELGIRVKIISGDHHLVVSHLAGQIGLGEATVTLGRDIATLRDDALCHLALRCDPIAEVDPTQKERVVLALKKMGRSEVRWGCLAPRRGPASAGLRE